MKFAQTKGSLHNRLTTVVKRLAPLTTARQIPKGDLVDSEATNPSEPDARLKYFTWISFGIVKIICLRVQRIVLQRLAVSAFSVLTLGSAHGSERLAVVADCTDTKPLESHPVEFQLREMQRAQVTCDPKLQERRWAKKKTGDKPVWRMLADENLMFMDQRLRETLHPSL